jgi:hypothetical protein
MQLTLQSETTGEIQADISNEGGGRNLTSFEYVGCTTRGYDSCRWTEKTDGGGTQVMM